MSEAKKTSLYTVDLIKYLCAIVIIIVHCERVIDNPLFHHLLKNVLGRITVPFFMVTTGYFIKQKLSQNPNYAKKYLVTLTKTYLLWCAIYLPFGLEYIHNNMNIPVYLYPVVLVLGVVYIGTYYHLWYIPAIIFAVILSLFLLKKMRYRNVLILSTILYIIGSVETYSGYLSETIFAKWFYTYQTYFMTTRNGLFYALTFVLIGYVIYDYNEKLKKIKHIGFVTIISAILLILEGVIIFLNQGFDKNFLLMLIPFMLFFTYWALNTNPVDKDSTMYRNLSKYYFFLHPIPIFFVNMNLETLRKFLPIHDGWIRFIIAMIVTHTLSLLMIRLQKTIKNKNTPIAKLLKYL